MKIIISTVLLVFTLGTHWAYINTDIKNNREDISIGFKDLQLIGTLEKKIDEEIADKEALELCENWSFNEHSLNHVLKDMRQVKPSAWYALCYNYPCWYTGKVSNGQKEYDIGIYAGGYIILSNGLEVLHFISEKKSDLYRNM